MRAMPVCGPCRPIQLTDVPVKVNVARAPAVVETAAVRPLHAVLVSPCVQSAVYVAAVSSKRVPATGGGDEGPTSNASTTTALSTADGFFSPVDWTINVWVPGVRPVALKIVACTCSVVE